MTKKSSDIRKYLAALPAVIIMAVIFYFSGRDADISTGQSMTISYLLAEAGGYLRGVELKGYELELAAANMEGYVRKAAHMFEFGMLSLSVWFALSFWTGRRKVLFILTIVISTVYAASDEFHQRFVPGREGTPRDVLVDSVGILIVAVILFLRRSSSSAPEGGGSE